MTIWPGWKTFCAGTASPSRGAAGVETAGAVKYSGRDMRERAKTADSSAPGQPGQPTRPDMYRSALAPLTWWVWVAFAVANLIDIAVQGRDRLSVTAAAALLLATAVAYVAALRPRVIADPSGIVVRNPLRDHRLPWPSVQRVDLGTVLRVHCSWQEAPGKGHGQQDAPRPQTAERARVFHAWALQSSPRPSSVTGLRAGSGRDDVARRSVGGYGRPPDPPGLAHRKQTERIARALDERARAERRPAQPTGSDADGAQGGPAADGRTPAGPHAAANPGPPARPVSAWHWPSVVALLLAAALLTAAILA